MSGFTSLTMDYSKTRKLRNQCNPRRAIVTTSNSNNQESIVAVTLRPSTVGWPNGRFQLILKQVINHDLGKRTNKKYSRSLHDDSNSTWFDRFLHGNGNLFGQPLLNFQTATKGFGYVCKL